MRRHPSTEHLGDAGDDAERALRDLSVPQLATTGLVLIALGAALTAVIWALTSAASVPRTPAVTESQARAIALGEIGSRSNPLVQSGAPLATGWVITSDRYEPNGARVTDSSGHVVMTTSSSFCLPIVMSCSGSPVWEVELSAPAQGQWARYGGIVGVDANSGRVRSMSVEGRN